MEAELNEAPNAQNVKENSDAAQHERNTGPAEVSKDSPQLHTNSQVAVLGDQDPERNHQRAAAVAVEDVDMIEGHTLDEDDDVSPGDALAEFDWQSLQEEYHDRIKAAAIKEEIVIQEFEDLMQYFSVWASAGSNQETNRTFARFKTRMFHVQHSEQDFEQRRRHYTNCVEMFRQALHMLNTP